MYSILVLSFLLLSTSYKIAFIGTDLQLFEIVNSSLQKISTSIIVQNFTTIEKIPLINIQDLNLVIDATTNKISHSQVISFSKVFFVPIIIIGHGNSNDQVFFTDFDYNCQISAVTSVFDYFSIKKLGVVWSHDAYNEKIIESLENTSQDILFASVGSLMPASETTLLFGKVFKAKGIQNYLFLGDKNLCSQYEKSFQSSFLENEGVIAVFLNECVYQTTSNGSLILTNYKTINSNSYKDYISSSLYQYFAVFKAKSLSNP